MGWGSGKSTPGEWERIMARHARLTAEYGPMLPIIRHEQAHEMKPASKRALTREYGREIPA